MRPVMSRVAAGALLALAMASGCAHKSTLEGDAYAARKKLVRELIAREQWDAAFSYVDPLHREDPRDAEVLTLRGIVFRERGLPDEAEADLTAALSADPNLTEAHAALGILYDSSSRGEAAEPHHRAAVRLDPANPAYLNNLGFSLFLRGKTRAALEIYQQAARLAPTAHRVRTNLGFAYAAVGDLPRAAREFELGGTKSEARNNLGYAYEQRGDLARAYDLYLEAVRIEPRAQRPRKNLIHVAEKLGKEVPTDLAKENVPQ